LPVVHEGGMAKLAEGAEAKAILDGFEKRSREILAPGFVEASFSRWSEEAFSGAMRVLSGTDRLLLKIDRHMGNRLVRRAFTRQRMIDTMDLIECDALREQLLSGLKNRLGI
jgi:hypothetical protein